MLKPLNGNFDPASSHHHAVVLNMLLEQLIVIRADLSALHGVIQFLATKQGIPVEKLQEMRIALRDKSYDTISPAVLQTLATELKKVQPPPESGKN